MTKYRCNRCNYETTSKRSAEKHLEKIRPCEGTGEIKLITLDEEVQCKKCGKKYSTEETLKRHLKTACKVAKQEENQKLKDKIEELERLVKTSSNTTNNTTNNTNSNNTTTNNTQINNNYITISLTPYNDPNMEGMQQYLEAAIRKTFLSVPNLIESVHFNDQFPENQNICITNRRTKDAKVFDGKRWKTMNKDLLINEMVDTYERELTNFAEEKGNTKYIKNYESAKKRGNAEKDLIEEVHNVIYDNSDRVNTKIKEVKKPVKQLAEKEQQSESETSEDENFSEPPEEQGVDEYEEFRKQLDDSDSDSESSEE
jgi:hypothetical protein